MSNNQLNLKRYKINWDVFKDDYLKEQIIPVFYKVQFMLPILTNC